VSLRAATPDDIAWIDAQQRRPELAAVIYSDGPERLRASLSDPDRDLLIWAEQGSPAGFAILRGLARADRVVELLRLVVARPGQGIGARFLEALQEHVFARRGAHRMWLDHFEDNRRAARAYARAGFVQEGVLREHALRATGERGSLVLMGLLRSEWEAARRCR